MVTDWVFLCHSLSFLLGKGAFVSWWGKHWQSLAGGMRRLVEREGGEGFKGEKLSHDQNCKLCFLAFIPTNRSHSTHSGLVWSHTEREGASYYHCNRTDLNGFLEWPKVVPSTLYEGKPGIIFVCTRMSPQWRPAETFASPHPIVATPLTMPTLEIACAGTSWNGNIPSSC